MRPCWPPPLPPQLLPLLPPPSTRCTSPSCRRGDKDTRVGAGLAPANQISSHATRI